MTEFLGTRPERVIQLLKDRRSRLAKGSVSDYRKLGLVVEGGGMRGVLSAGSLLSIDLLGFRDCVDVVYAVSAGSVNAAYFLSGQGVEGITIYFDDVSSRRFINPWRPWKMVDVDFVFDEVVQTVKPLKEAAILGCPQEFYVTATDVSTGQNVMLNTKSGCASISRYLKASSALPVLYNRSIQIGNQRYMDGGLSGGIPIDWAVAQGCTDILVLLSREPDYVSRGPGFYERWLFRLVAGLKYPAVYQAFCGTSSTKNKNRSLAVGVEQISAVNVVTFCPDAEENSVSRITIARPALVHGAYLTALKVYRAFGESTTDLDDLFDGFKRGGLKSS